MSEITKKVLWVIPGARDSKVNMIFAKRLIPELKKNHYEILEFYLESRKNPLKLFKDALRLRKLISREEIKLVHAQYGSTTGLFATLTSPVKTIVHFRGSDINSDPRCGPFTNVLTKLFSQVGALFACHCIFVSKQLYLKLKVKPKSYSVIPSPIDFNKFHPMDREECKNRVGLDLTKRYIAFVSSSQRSVKRPELARAAAKLLKNRIPNSELLEIYNISPDDMPLYLNSCEALVLTSVKEGSPNCVKEALACGVPVVSVDVGDVASWIDTRLPSRIVPDSQSEIAHALALILEKNNATRVPLIDKKDVGLEETAKKNVNLYDSLLSTCLL